MRKRFGQFTERFPLAAFGLDILAVVVAVLLALAVDEWRDARADEELRQRALQSIAQEIRLNREQIEARVPYHETIRDTIAAALQGRPVSSFQEMFDRGFQGFRTYTPLDAALETAQSTGAIGEIDYALAQRIVRVYSVQEALDLMGRQVLSAISYPGALNPDNTESMLTSSLLNLNDILIRERALLEAYPVLLDAIEEAGVSVSSPDSLAATR